MRLQQVGLRGRRFLIQYLGIMEEFGSVVPWLAGMDDLRYATNAAHFRDTLLERTAQGDGDITPYQFVLPGRPAEFVGGVLHFTYSPERLRDPRNREAAERLVSEGVHFVSCLQVRHELRGQGIGDVMFRRAIATILSEKGAFWGVVSDPRLLPWYRSLGVQTPSPCNNRDGLWIVHYSREERS